ncbi:MAG: MoxR family ATPase [Actinomycetota bacterium]|nr:MoxR family ATPase [Actinomycetota bacterium]
MARQPTATTSLTFADAFERVVANVERVIQGKTDAIRLALCCLVAEGHLLIEDVPGVGKTSLAKALAASLGCTWHRIQFTPDLLPSDVTGASIYNRANGDFEFHPGPVFANLLLADEVNRASPKTQSALLEAMEERQVTVDASTFPLPAPFLVIATQNPIEHQGTYPLPESQLDRFLMRVPMGYPDRSSELAMLDTHGGGTAQAIDELEAVAAPAQVLAMVRAARAVHVAAAVKGYMVDVAHATRRHSGLAVGISPRATLALQRATRARAASQGRDFVSPDDVKALSRPVLEHRLVPSTSGALAGVGPDEALREALASVPVPVGRG